MHYQRTLGLIALALLAASCASTSNESTYRTRAVELMLADFKTRGIASIDRLKQDETQALCSQYRDNVPPDIAERIRERNLAAVKYPADGKFLGDWKQGEKIAQSGRGLQFTDKPDTVNGGNCYACHRLSPQELSYGTIGPSLYNYGKIRGYGPEVQKYTYAKIYNPQAFVACSNMPRFGHNGILTEEQIKHVVALLLDPESPVNK
ncbi:MAG TPA: sulfur oxidation c-type cytochrome SoxX [Burkholderiales bacterium]